jgi:hypothetical protein
MQGMTLSRPDLNSLRAVSTATIVKNVAAFRAEFLHAIAERRQSLSQYAHRAYVQVAYGYRTGAYRPRYVTAAEIAARAAGHRSGPFYAFRNPKLSFGVLITTFPVGTKIDG